jgi:predicted Zn-dependent protease
MGQAGYDPRSMVRVMQILAEAGGGGGRQPEFFSTHPSPENRIGRLEEAIAAEFPSGLPAGLEP